MNHCRCERRSGKFYQKVAVTALLTLLLLHVEKYGPPMMMVMVVQAKCFVKNERGRRVHLHEDGNLPPGVEYDVESDTLQCLAPNSCRRWRISGCNMVQCRGSHSCQNTLLIENMGTACWAYAACQKANIYSSHNVACGAASVNSCAQALVQADTSILCFGENSCVSDYQNRIVFDVGSHGFISCQGTTGGGQGLSCQNMDVQVHDPQRACIITNAEMHEKVDHSCAVVCGAKEQCDEDSIRFRLG